MGRQRERIVGGADHHDGGHPRGRSRGGFLQRRAPTNAGHGDRRHVFLRARRFTPRRFGLGRRRGPTHPSRRVFFPHHLPPTQRRIRLRGYRRRVHRLHRRARHPGRRRRADGSNLRAQAHRTEPLGPRRAHRRRGRPLPHVRARRRESRRGEDDGGGARRGGDGVRRHGRDGLRAMSRTRRRGRAGGAGRGGIQTRRAEDAPRAGGGGTPPVVAHVPARRAPDHRHGSGERATHPGAHARGAPRHGGVGERTRTAKEERRGVMRRGRRGPARAGGGVTDAHGRLRHQPSSGGSRAFGRRRGGFGLGRGAVGDARGVGVHRQGAGGARARLRVAHARDSRAVSRRRRLHVFAQSSHGALARVHALHARLGQHRRESRRGVVERPLGGETAGEG